MKSINRVNKSENIRPNNVSNLSYRLQRNSFAKKTEKKLKKLINKIRKNKRNIIKFVAGTVIVGTIAGSLINRFYVPEINTPVETVINYNSDHIYIDELMDKYAVKDYVQLCNSIDICDLISNLDIDYNDIYEPITEEDVQELSNYTLEDTMTLINEYNNTKSDELASKLYYLRNYNYNYVIENGSENIEDFLLVFIKSTLAYSLNINPNEISDMTIPPNHGKLDADDSMVVRYNEDVYHLDGNVETMCYNLYDIQSNPLTDYESISNFTNTINYYMFFDTSFDEKGFLGLENNVVETDYSKKYYKEYKKDFK